MKYLITLFIILFLSCGNITTTDDRTDSEILSDLKDISLIIPAIESGLALTDETSETVKTAIENNRSRGAIDPTKITDSQMSVFFGSDWQNNPYKPSEVYSNSGVTGTLRIPTTGYISGFDGNVNNDFYMNLTPISGTAYNIEVYVYPRDIFDIDYDFVEYVVDESDTTGSWAWSYWSSRGVYNEYTNWTTYYRDGGYSDRTINNSGHLTLNDLVSDSPSMDSDISTVLNNLSDYQIIDKKDPAPSYYTGSTTSDNSLWSSTSDFLLHKGGDANLLKGLEYYTEDGTYNYSYLCIIGNKSENYRHEIVRYIQDSTNNLTNILSMYAGDYYTQITHTYKTANTYSSEVHLWWENAASTLDTNTAASVITEISDTDGDGTYSGTVTNFWGSTGEEYDYSLNSLTGDISIMWAASKTRSVSSLTISTIDLNNIEIDDPGLAWSFAGSYENGSLYGTYTYDNFSVDVEIRLEGLDIDNSEKFLKWN